MLPEGGSMAIDGNIEERILGGDKAAMFQWKSKRKGGNCG